MYQKYDMTQYEAAHRRRTFASAVIIFGLMPLTLLVWVLKNRNHQYLLVSFIILFYTMMPFFMIFEHRKPKAREIVLIAMMTALTVLAQIVFHITVPVNAGTAMVVISGVALGPEAGFLTGAMARFVCNFYQGQGAWTPWQMFCWGLLGFLAGLCFNKVTLKKNAFEKKDEAPLAARASRSFRVVVGPVLFIAFAEILAYFCYVIWPRGDDTFFGWRLYVFGAAGLLAGVLFQRKRLPVDGITLVVFTFFTTFIIYGGIMNIAAMVTSSTMAGGKPVSLDTLRALYITGAPYDFMHALEAAIFVFLFGESMTQKIERIKIKYGIYR
ncbi:MAG: ECF transporter S component [Anaerovoracaceae bacterium]